MKPLFLIYSNRAEPFLTLARQLKEQVRDLDAGDICHVIVEGPGEGMDFFAEANGLLYPYISKAIAIRPIILTDCDAALIKPLDHLFETDWDIAAAFRLAQRNGCGRQDYGSGFVALNNRRATVIKKFWIEWTYRIAFWQQCKMKPAPRSLTDEGWFNSWFADQSALNHIILPEGNRGDPEHDSYKIITGVIYEAGNYKILPLERRIYAAHPKDSNDALMIQYKGKSKFGRERKWT